jgi:hypothetical protein
MTAPIQAALQFIREARRDRAIQRAMAALDDELSLERIVEVAEAAGFRFTVEALQRAHAHDWAMRWARHHPEGPGGRPAPSP